MFTMSVLLCLAGTAPAACTPATAIDVVPLTVTELQCAFPGQAIPDLDRLRAQGLVVVLGRCERTQREARREMTP